MGIYDDRGDGCITSIHDRAVAVEDIVVIKVLWRATIHDGYNASKMEWWFKKFSDMRRVIIAENFAYVVYEWHLWSSQAPSAGVMNSKIATVPACNLKAKVRICLTNEPRLVRGEPKWELAWLQGIPLHGYMVVSIKSWPLVTERDSKSCVYSRARPDAPRMREHATHPNLSESWSDYDYKIIAIMITWLFWARFAVID